MKIVRFLDNNGAVAYGRVHGNDLAQVERLAGDPFTSAGLQPTGETVMVGKLLAPVAPVNILCIGLNYRKHADESGMAHPERPILFLKPTTTVIASGEVVIIPAQSTEVDYECELAVVIGKAARDVPEADALGYVWGYTCANDVSARDWQLRLDKQWARGKSFDTFCPLGPVLATADEIPNPNALPIRTRLNNELVQDSNTGDMIFTVAQIIAYLSRNMTLAPGTVILTGTPEGVGMGRKPPHWLRSGDICTVEIDGIGALTNPLVGESA